VTHFIAGLGTSGTLMGAGRYLREQSPSFRLIAGQPDDGFHGLEGPETHADRHQTGHLSIRFCRPHVLEVSTEAAHAMVLRLAREEGLFVGISSGAAAVAACRWLLNWRKARL
jgi:S-sulfo-L-cysteine synthase (O-acetyl-L-serine-dependent)